VRYGYRRVHVMLRREGWNVNAKKVYRIYNELGLQLRNKTPSGGSRQSFGTTGNLPRNPMTPGRWISCMISWQPAGRSGSLP
jgi:hypothetical protein